MPNPRGRPKGSKNKVLKEHSWKKLEEKMSGDFTDYYINIMTKYYEEGNHKEYVKCYEAMTKYFKPALKAQDIQVDSKVEIKIISDDKINDKI